MNQNTLHQVLDTLNYVRRFSGHTIIVKLSGTVLVNSSLLTQLCEELAAIQSVGISLVLIHGGGPSINYELERQGVTWTVKDGQRVTSPEMMSVIEQTLVGQINQKIVRGLNQAGIGAIGLSGASGKLLFCQPYSQDHQRVGRVVTVNTSLLNHVLNFKTEQGHSYIPVIAPVGIDAVGQALNVNADWAACEVAKAMKVKKVIYLTDQQGILDRQGRLISEVDATQLQSLIKDGVVSDGMLAKAETIVEGLRHQIQDIHIIDGRRPLSLIQELFTEHGSGTVCRRRSKKTILRQLDSQP